MAEINIGLKVDYKKTLDKMIAEFNTALQQISGNVKKSQFQHNIEDQIKAIEGKISGLSDEFKAEFERINNQRIDSSNFESYQKEVTKKFEKIKTSISGVTKDIKGLEKQIGMLKGADFVSNMTKQFDELCQGIKDTYKELSPVVDMINNFSENVGKNQSVDGYKNILEQIKQANKEIENAETDFKGAKPGKIAEAISIYKKAIDETVGSYRALKEEIKGMSESDVGYAEKEKELAQYTVTLYKAREMLDELRKVDKFGLVDSDYANKVLAPLNGIENEVGAFERKMAKAVQGAKEAKNQIQTTFNTFQVKDGAIHIPIDLATTNEELKGRILNIVRELQEYTNANPVIAKVKLTLDKSSTKGYEKNSEIDKQQAEGQNEPALDITKTIQGAYRNAAREAKQIVKTEIKKIQEEFESVPIKIKPDTDAFEKEVSSMVNGTLEKIANETSGININEELEKLVTNLKEVSSSLSGNENFKLGLDEASIERITAAIKDMADMIQRAFGVASNDDIAAQWTTIESKFKGVAGEEGKLLKGNKEHKVAIQELAVEYKKYLDMGGKNDLSALTAHKQTVKNIVAEYENLVNAIQEATQKQEKVTKKPASAKISSEEKEAINGITRENQKLETQAGKTGTALDNEGKKAQSAAEKFRKLAKEKGAAVYANRELAKAAKETADALEKEANIRKETGAKTGKNAVDGDTYSANNLKWQNDIKKSLLDGGNYAEVYGAKISQAANGNVKFTASVKTMNGEWKQFAATVNSSGDILFPTLKDIDGKQALLIEKRLEAEQKIREAMANMDGEGEGDEPIRLDRSELELYADEIQRILKDLEELSKTTYKVDITSGGKLSITRKEIADSGAEAEQFTVIIDRIDSIFEETADGIVVSANKIQEALDSAFDGATISTSTKDLVSKAQRAFDLFELNNSKDVNFDEIVPELLVLLDGIKNIDSQDKLDKFNHSLSELGTKLKTIKADNALGELFGTNQAFNDIKDAAGYLDILFTDIGEVNKKSIEIKGLKTLIAEVKDANGEIHQMTVNLDSNNFARFVDNGIKPKTYNAKELQEYVAAISEATRSLETFNTKYKVSLSNNGKLTITKELKDVDGTVKTFVTSFNSVADVIDETTGAVKNLADVLEDAFDSGKFSTTIKDWGSEAAKMYNSFTDKYKDNAVYKTMAQDIFDGISQMSFSSKTDVDALSELLSRFAQKIDEITKGQAEAAGFVKKATDAFNKFVINNQDDPDYASFKTTIDDLQNRASTISNQGDLDKFKHDLADIVSKLRLIKSDYKLGDIIDDQRTFNNIKEVKEELGSLFQSIGKVNEKTVKIKNMEKLTAEVKKANGEIHKMSVSMDSNGFVRYVDNGIVQFSRLRRFAEDVFKGIGKFVQIYLSPQDFIRYFRQGFDTVREIDTAMTELKKVTDATPDEVGAYFGDAVASAKELGSSVNEMISATADWQRMGYNLPDSKELGEIAVLYKNVGDGIDVDTANESLISTLQGFQMNASDAMSIIDAFNEVSNNYAISSGGLGEALKRSAAAFHVANTDLNKSIALVTATNEVIQNPEKVGTLYQTVSARIRGAKTELEEMGGETEGMVESTSKLRELVKGMTGFDIMEDENTYKDIYEIIVGIGEEWKNLEDIDRAALLEALAGKRQSNALAAVLSNIQGLEGAYDTAKKSGGSALREQAKYTESLQYSIDQLTAHTEEFWSAFINKDDMKTFLGFLADIISFGTDIVDTFGSLGTVLGVLSGVGIAKSGLVPTAFNTLSMSSFNPKDMIGGLFKQEDILDAFDISSLEAYNDAIAKGTNASVAFNQTMNNASDAAKKMAKSAGGAAVDISAIGKTSKAATIGVKALNMAMKVCIATLAMIAVSAIISAISNIAHASEMAIENADELNSKLTEQQNVIASNKKAIDAISSDYERLSQGVSDTGTNISLTTEEYARYNDIVNQIASMFPTMVQGYTAEGNAIIAHKGNVEELTRAYKEQAKAARDTIISKGDDVFSGAKAEIDELNTKLDVNKAARWLLNSTDISNAPFSSDIIQKAESLLQEQGIKKQIQQYASGNTAYTYQLPQKWNKKTQQYDDPLPEDVKLRAEKRNNLERDYNLLLSQREGILSKTNNVIQAYLENEITYENQNEDIKKFISMLSSSLDPSNFDFDDDKMKAWIKNNVLIPISNSSPEVKQTVSDLFSLDKVKLPATEWEKQANELIEQITSVIKFDSEDDKNTFIRNLKIKLGFEFTSDGKTTTDTMKEQIRKRLKEEDSDFVDSLTQDELKVAVNVVTYTTFSKISKEQLIQMMNDVKSSVEDSVSLDVLETAADGIKNLATAYSDLSKDGSVNIKTLNEIRKSAGMTTDEFEKYKTVLMSGNKNSAEFKRTMADLTYTILEKKMGSKELVNATKEEIAAVLRENGVLNANAVAESIVIANKDKKLAQSTELARSYLYEKLSLDELVGKTDEEIEALLTEGHIKSTVEERTYLLAQAKEALRIKTAMAKTSTAEEVVMLATEATQAGITGKALNDIVLKVGIFNNASLDVSQKVKALQEMGYYAHWVAQGIEGIANVKMVNVEGTNYVASYDKDGKLIGIEKEKEIKVPKIEIPKIEIPDYSGVTKDKSGKTPFDDTYYSAINAWLEENEKEIEKFEEERESLNRKFENTLDIGNKEQAEILRTKLSENAKTQKDILHRQNEAHRITKNDLLTSLYEVAPELNGKAWEDISEVELTKIENSLNHTAEMASDDNAKNQAKLTSNRFKGIIEDLRAIDEAIKANSDAWLEEDENARGYWESLIDFQDSYSNEWIENQKAYDNLTEQEELNAYSRMINNYKEFQRQILADMSLSEDAKLALIKKSNELIDDYSEKHYQLQKEASWNNSNNWINDRNTYNDWALFNDSEVEAWERVLLRIRSEYPKDLEKIREAEKNLFEARKKEFDKANDFSSSYLESQKTILQAQYDVENSLAEARHEINKELETSMTMYGYLEEDTRKLLFNQEDYNTLVKELNGIENKASRLQDEYDRKLRNSTLETVESITSEYQMQYETLMKSYEIAKADLEIAKKKQKLNNVLNERNVRMFINGSWQWVANTEDVANAKAELADAEYAKQVEQAGLTQQKSINELTKKQDALALTIKLFDNGVIDLKEAVRLAKDAIGDMPFALYDAYSKMGSSLSSSGSRGSSGSSSGGSSSSASNATAWIPGLGNVGVTIGSDGRTKNSGLPVGTIVHTGGGDYKITGSSGGNYISEPVKKKLASGSRYTSGGMTLMGEEGFEAYITSEGRLIPIAQPTIGNIPSGGVVFNKDQLSGLRTLWDMSNLKFNTDRGYIGSAQPQQVDQSQDNRIIINGMTVDSGSSDGQALISALRRYVGNH